MATVYTIPADILEALEGLPFNDGLVALWNHILIAHGKPTLADSTEPIRPQDYALPEAQTKALLDAWSASAKHSERPGIMMTWCNVGPSTVKAEG